jgi:hypothetical protein
MGQWFNSNFVYLCLSFEINKETPYQKGIIAAIYEWLLLFDKLDKLI